MLLKAATNKPGFSHITYEVLQNYVYATTNGIKQKHDATKDYDSFLVDIFGANSTIKEIGQTVLVPAPHFPDLRGEELNNDLYKSLNLLQRDVKAGKTTYGEHKELVEVLYKNLEHFISLPEKLKEVSAFMQDTENLVISHIYNTAQENYYETEITDETPN